MENTIPTDKRLLIIAGSGRKSGKTTLVLKIISKFSAKSPILGLKVCTKKVGDDQYHGNHETIAANSYSIYKESDPSLDKDTAKMLKAGAINSYLILSDVSKVIDSYMAIQTSAVAKNQFIVCESGSLRNHIRPGLFIFLNNPLGTKTFKGIFEPGIDIIIDASENSNELEKLFESIVLGPDGWSYNKDQ